MARPPTPVGTYGRIGFTRINGSVRARAFYRDVDGVTRPVTKYGPTRAAAERALKEAIRDRVGRGEDLVRVRDVAELWRSEVDGDEHLAPGTKDRYLWVLDKHVLPGVGELLIREANVSRLDRFLKDIKSTSGPAAAKTCKTVAGLMFGLAVRHGAMEINPVRSVERLRAGRKSRPRALAADETVDFLKRLRAVIGHGSSRRSDEVDLVELVEFMLGTGMRVGEVLGVRRTSVDFETKTLEVNSIAVPKKGTGMVLQERTKSDAGWRVLALPDHVVNICQRQAASSASLTSEHGLLFPTEVGGVRAPSNVARGLRVVTERMKAFGWITSHTFRRTVATRLDEAGLSARVIADQLGHAKPSMTQDRYMGRNVVSAKAAEALEVDS